ncbi:hypothetical protein [Sphingomonas crocodyli]|uniref:DUF4279 domain-containing protein n=1 Tax=Sphingomonas crocodyli TaxID=1979270 RepID=A0A437LXN7_9SPHN|nr:hypothetical protein [Sphingomonas crocodyli]RVT90169.1 hypothetical protein EOD43_17855 [Sphingomonas crocodyli]
MFGHLAWCELIKTGIGNVDASFPRMSFKYRVWFQVRHPDHDAEDIIEQLGLAVARSWQAGQPRLTARGDNMPGQFEHSLCIFDVGSGDDGQVASRLRTVINLLQTKADFMQGLTDTGGALSFHISWMVGPRGAVLNNRLLNDMAALGIDLAIDPVNNDQAGY